MDLSKYRQLFVSETQEMLERLGSTLVALEGSPDSTESINTAFRHFHSLKGMSGTMGFSPMFELSHQLEELMSRVRVGRLALGPAIVDLLLAGVDQLGTWVGEIDSGGAPASEAHGLNQRIRRLLGATAPPPAADISGVTALASRPGDLVLHADLKEPAEISIRGYLLVRRLGSLGSVIDTVPSIDRLRSGLGSAQIKVALRGAAVERVRAFLEALPDWVIGRLEEAGRESDAEDDDELVFTGSFGSAPPSRPSRPAAIVRPAQPPRSIRVRTAWIDQMLGRLEALRESALSIEHPALHAQIAALEREASTVRLVPLSVITDRLPRVVRDHARQVGKKANLVVEGADERIDRSIVEGIDAALTHLVRNAIEHGIEAPPGRAAANKPEVGVVTLHIHSTREAVFIELTDDGAGIDTESLARRACELGLLDEQRAWWLAEHDACQLLCLPGLTTRAVADSGAGRGIGMDAVAADVRALGGGISIRSQSERGTTFQIRLPKIRGVTGLLFVRVAGQIFAVQRAWIHARILGPAIVRTATMVRYDGREWPIRVIPDVTPSFGGMVLLFDNPATALVIDEVVGEHDLLIQPLPTPLDRLPGLMGAVRIAGDPPVLVLAIDDLAAG